jgi:hypothetical protein
MIGAPLAFWCWRNDGEQLNPHLSRGFNMAQSSVWKRRKWIIQPGFQWSVVLRVLLPTVIIAVFFAWNVYYFFWKSGMQRGEFTALQQISQGSLWFWWALCLAALLLIPVLIMIKTTHRIAGQMFRFERELDRVLSGKKAEPICTRSDDYFHEFEKDLNRCLLQEVQE